MLAAKQPVGEAEDQGERGAQLVADVRHELALELVELAELLVEAALLGLGAFALGDVEEEADEAGLAGELDALHVEDRVADVALLRANGALVVGEEAFFAELADRGGALLGGPHAELDGAVPDDLVAGIAEHADECVVAVGENAAIEGGDADGDGARLKEAHEGLVVVALGLCGGGDGDGADDGALGIRPRGDVDLHGAAGGERDLGRGLRAGERATDERYEGRQSLQGGRVAACGGEDVAVAIDDDESDGGGLEERLQALLERGHLRAGRGEEHEAS